MSLLLTRWSTLPGGESDAFRRRFAACAPDIRSGPTAAYAPSAAYAAAVLDAVLPRDAEMLLVTAGDCILGRAAVVASQASADAVTIGLFETTLGPHANDVTTLLTDAARAWSALRGRSTIYAPVDGNTWFSYRFALPGDAGHEPGTVYAWEPVQPPEYVTLFEARGFDVAERYRTVFADFDDGAAARAARETAPALEAALAAGYRVERLDDGALSDLVDELRPLCMNAFRDNPLFEPLPLEALRAMYGTAAANRDCSLTHWMRDPNGRLAAFMFVFVDRGAVVIKTIAVEPAARGQRLSTALVHLVLDAGARRNHRSFISALVRHGNTSEFLARPYLIPGTTSRTRDYVLLKAPSGPAR